jgi:EAL domain-containing protein (putative c-di-GMP-specific phosphodiesterase class I)
MLPIFDALTLYLLATQEWGTAVAAAFSSVVASHLAIAWVAYKSRPTASEADGQREVIRRYRELQTAIEDGGLVLHYQPEVSLADDQVHAVEALVRWRRPDGELMQPMEFIPFAEESGLIRPLGTWVLREACAQLAVWRESIPRAADVLMSVNVSAVQLDHPKFVATVQTAIQDYGLSPADLILEVTESSLVSDPKVFRVILRQLQDLGLRIALDDFGTGYASINYLRAFKFDFVKLDRSFIAPLETGYGDADLVAGLVTLAKSLGSSVIAEGVSSGALAYDCRVLGCDWAQGFFYSTAVSGPEIEAILLSQNAAEIAA